MAKRKWHPRTIAVRTQVEVSAQCEHSVPIYLTSSYRFDNLEHGRALFAREIEGNIYGRYSNPNARELVNKIAALEGAEAGLAFSSGMAALFAALLGLLEQGQRVVASSCLFGSTLQILTRLLPKWGIEAALVHPSASTEEWERALDTGNARLCLIETPSNPMMDIIDISALARLCHAKDVIFVVDNAYATPVLQSPIALGAHLVMHTATKFIDGQGRGLGGVLCGDPELIKSLEFFLRHTGPTISPFNAWMFSKSLEHLELRLREHCANALALAEFLEPHERVEWVRYPGLASHPQHELAMRQMKLGGGLLTFHLRGPADAFVDNLEMCSLSANLGDTRTIVTHPRTTTHSSITEEERLAIGITDRLVRISAGLEHIDDIIADVDQALAAS